MIVLGADLSWTRTGLVWCSDKFEVVARTQGFKVGPSRLLNTYHWMVNTIGTPDLCVIEDNAYGAPSRVVVVKLSQLNTLMKLACEACKVPWLEVSPGTAKKHITGKGNADKSQVASELVRRWGIKFENDDKKGYDLSDAAALAVLGLEKFHEKKKIA